MSRGYMWYYEAFQIKLSCPSFHFQSFPFDTHKCCLEYGNAMVDTSKVLLKVANIIYGDVKTKEGSINVKDLTFPFDMKIESQPAFIRVNKLIGRNHSYTGMCFKMRRNSYGQLFGGFYIPTLSFAVLSLVSYLIQPDIVST